MDVEKNWRSYLFHPLFIGFVVSTVVIFVFIRIFPRYKYEIVESFAVKNKGQLYYVDLDEDGKSEQLHLYQYDRVFEPTLYLYDAKDQFKFLWNFHETPVKGSEIFTGDFNNNSIKEIFLFTAKSDSVFLYVLNSESDKESYLNRKFISELKNIDQAQIKPVGLYDFNKDGFKDFLFYIDAGYPNSPRKLYSLNMVDGLIKTSNDLLVKVGHNVIVQDINQDGEFEIIVSGQSVKIPGNGYKSQLLILNHNLENLFDPVDFNGIYSNISIGLLKTKNEWNIVCLNSSGQDDMFSNNLIVYNSTGNKISEKPIDNNKELSIIDYTENNSFLLKSKNRLFKMNDKLDISDFIKLSKNQHLQYITKLNIGEKGNIYLFKDSSDLLIVRNHADQPVIIEDAGNEIPIVSKVIIDDAINYLSVQFPQKSYLIYLYESDTIFHSVLFQIAMFLLIIIIIYFVSRLMMLKSKIKEKVEAQNNEYAAFEENIQSLDNDKMEHLQESKLPLDQITFTQENTKRSDSIQAIVDFYSKELEIHLDTNSAGRLVNELEQEIKNNLKKFIGDILDLLSKQQVNEQIHISFKQSDKLIVLFEIDKPNVNFESILSHLHFNDYENKFAWIAESVNNTESSVLTLIIPKGSVENKGSKIKVIIAEDHDVSLFGLISLFKVQDDIEIVGTAKNGMEVLKILETKNADVVITDISMPGMDGIELSEKLQNEYPKIKVIVFTMYMENWFVEQLIKNGVMGYVSKNSKINELIGAVKDVKEGKNYYCPQFKSKFGINTGMQNGSDVKLDSLTKAELELMKCMADNMSKKEISEKLEISLIAVNDIIANILLKVNAGDEDEIIKIAKKQKFISE